MYVAGMIILSPWAIPVMIAGLVYLYTSPEGSNLLRGLILVSGVVFGACLGAAIGMLVPGIGTLIGLTVGATIGFSLNAAFVAIDYYRKKYINNPHPLTRLENLLPVSSSIGSPVPVEERKFLDTKWDKEKKIRYLDTIHQYKKIFHPKDTGLQTREATKATPILDETDLASEYYH